MKKIILLSVLFLVLSLSISSVIAVSQDELNQAKVLIDSNISCNQLTNDQLEIIGEYYMEQMMPGIAHVRAHQMMGLTEGSEAEEQFHINMAKRIYCGENVGSGMIGGGMMGNYYYQNPRSNNSYQNNIFGFLFMALILVALILFVLWLIKQSQKDNKRR